EQLCAYGCPGPLGWRADSPSWHEGSSGTGNGPESRNAGRMGSRSWPSSRGVNSANISSILGRRSDSRGH
ncbi:hypothetical protein BJV78DRAFT_1239646, partial [Lactifluus subvellereus]